MTPKEKELVDQIKKAEERIEKEERELKPYWYSLCFAAWSIPSFWEGGETLSAIGGFWLGVAVAYLAMAYNSNYVHQRNIRADRNLIKINQRLLDALKSQADCPNI